ncbi:hypothetical protein GIB67_038536 [Kingdonia uniflora]|uniref:PHD-type domain-containing protein n=1 Tax=Kingdonia uniflora TaxID=39325 RepID=A0A7J7NPD3_9MAGN|nr:hypothetical protein GIB67_038536 [Kingdonia uniflora]
MSTAVLCPYYIDSIRSVTTKLTHPFLSITYWRGGAMKLASLRKASTCPLCKANFFSITKVDEAASCDQKIYSQTIPHASSASDILVLPDWEIPSSRDQDTSCWVAHIGGGFVGGLLLHEAVAHIGGGFVGGLLLHEAVPNCCINSCWLHHVLVHPNQFSVVNLMSFDLSSTTLFCTVCRSREPEDLLICCDRCRNRWIHSYCLDPPMEPWICMNCRDLRTLYLRYR